MDQSNIDKAIDNFMHPTVYTGVKPILLVAEELVTQQSVGQVVEAVWVGINSNKEFNYISKFAVSGKIFHGKYYEQSEMEPFCGRLALPNRDNLKNVVLHRDTIEKIKEHQSKRGALLDEINREFEDLWELYSKDVELYLFEKKDGDWEEELFSDFNINAPYKVVELEKESGRLHLQNPRTGKTQEFLNTDMFYGYISGSKADIAGLKLKSESFLKSIESLQKNAKSIIKNIEWLDLDDSRIEEVSKKLPKHPFEDYFKYVKKENIRDVEVADELTETLKEIILKHMPENDSPLGMKYIPIDKLLYLFHAIIPRDEALVALESCDVLYEPPAMLLGHGGECQLPPKFLVPIKQVASAYQQFPTFIDACKVFSK